MTTRFDEKDPSDVITLTFDFSDYATAVTAPAIVVTVAQGTDPSPSAILVGSPTVEGALVRQRVQNGVDGVTYAFQCAAYNGSDRYTIEAILPVRTRPALSTAVPIYVTEAKFEQRFGATELAELLSDGTNYAEAENDAAGLVNGFLAARYTLPLTSVPDMVIGWTCDVTRFKLWDDHAPEEIRKRYEDTLAQLKMVSQGLIALPPGSDGVSSASPIAFGGYSNDRVFTSTTLSAY